MKKKLRSNVRTRLVDPARYALALTRSRARRALGGPRPLRILLISDNASYTNEQQFAPIWRWADTLGRRFGIAMRYARLERARRWSAGALEGFDGVGLKMTWTTPAAQAIDTASHFHDRLGASGIPLAYFDGDDDLSVQWPAIFPLVRVYVKKHAFMDGTGYTRGYVGKSNLTDFVAHKYGTSFAGDPIPASEPLARGQIAKIRVGWNIALDDKIFELLRQIETRPVPTKDTDVVCRASVPVGNWMRPLREELLTRLQAMSPRFNVLAPSQRVSQEQYNQEMLRSRICVSPFGFGELCWRDFEAIASGCLLIKPDMSHINTRPNVFIAGKTYVPVRWDYADLEETCARYLADEPLRNRIVDEARRTLQAAATEDWFVGVFEELMGVWLHGDGLSAPAGVSAATKKADKTNVV